MGLTQYRYGLVAVAAVAIFTWLLLGITTFDCPLVDYYPLRTPDARIDGACDTLFTKTLRSLAGDLYRMPSYDFVYDIYFSYIWLFGIGFAFWYAGRTLYLRRQENQMREKHL